MRVRFWGTRGSIPTPGERTVRYGGNTSCVEVETAAGTRFILDSGTGIRELGLRLAAEQRPVQAHILLGHTHWDHIAGFPFFSPAFVPGNHFEVYGSAGLDTSLKSVIAGQMEYTYFPVPLDDLDARIAFHELGEGRLHIDGTDVYTLHLNHTTVCLGYRLEIGGASLAYVTDHEPYGLLTGHARDDGGIHDDDRRLVDFVRGVDLLIQDAQYTPEEYPFRRGWGHGSVDYVTDLAMAAGVRQLALFHHEPTHADDQMDEIVRFCTERVARAGSRLGVFGAAEGGEVVLAGVAQVPSRA